MTVEEGITIELFEVVIIIVIVKMCQFFSSRGDSDTLHYHLHYHHSHHHHHSHVHH